MREELSKRRRNARSKIINLTLKEKKSTSDCNLIYKRKDYSRTNSNLCIALCSFFENRRAFINSLSSSMLKKTAIASHIFSCD